MARGAGPKVGVIGLPGAWSTEALADALAERTGYRRVIDLADVTFDLASGEARHAPGGAVPQAVDLRDLDALVVKKIAATYTPAILDRLDLLAHLAALGLRVFSTPERMRRLVDRLSGTLCLRDRDIAMPDTVITERLDEAARAAERFGVAVLKPLYTSKARGMKLVQAGPLLARDLAEFRAAGNDLLYVQRAVDLAGGRDLGVAFVGERYLGCYARVRAAEAWSTSTAAGGRYEPHVPSEGALALARRARDAAGLDFTTVDVAETAAGPLVFEVSAFGGFRGLREGAGIDAASAYAAHVVEVLSRSRRAGLG
jgi:ribosomal protein S6--L-glutamate ligase